jgi:glycosyltransferase involved in cell wall biosynthesis
MKVVHISLADDGGRGGAAIAAQRIHSAVRNTGVHSTMLVEDKATSDSDVVPVKFRQSPDAVLLRKLRSYFLKRAATSVRDDSEFFSFTNSRFGNELATLIPDCDIIHIHQATSLLDFRSFFAKTSTTKFVWTLHDMNMFTGGCHFTVDCTNYRRQCGQCPQLRSPHPEDLSYRMLKAKQQGLAGLQADQLIVVAPSRWVCEHSAQSSLLSRFRHVVIPHGLDCNVFHPVDRTEAKAAFGIADDDSIVVAFIAESLTNKRKGFELALRVLDSIKGEFPVRVLAAGRGELEAGTPVINAGFIQSDSALAQFYSAADLTLVPSLQDIGPMTTIESLACGTPVVGFRVGMTADVVEHGSNGFLADELSFEGLRAALVPALAACDKMRQASRKTSLAKLDLPHLGINYRNVYQSLATDSKTR